MLIEKVIKILLIFIFIIIVAYLMLVSGVIYALTIPSPAKPEIKYGEFPFTITCELNGEEYTVEDVVICKYDGIKNISDSELGRCWKSYLQSDTERTSEVLLLLIEDGDITYELSSYYGDPAHYMGDYTYQSDYYSTSRLYDCEQVILYQWENDKRTFGEKITQEESMERFGFRIVEKQFSQPIENTFRKTRYKPIIIFFITLTTAAFFLYKYKKKKD